MRRALFNIANMSREEKKMGKKAIENKISNMKERYEDVYFIDEEFYKERLERYKNREVIREEIKAGIEFPIGRIHTQFKYNNPYKVDNDVATILASILEIVTLEILSAAAEEMDENTREMTPRHIMLAVKSDKEDLLPMFHNVIIASEKMVKNKNEALQKAKDAKKASAKKKTTKKKSTKKKSRKNEESDEESDVDELDYEDLNLDFDENEVFELPGPDDSSDD
jgi:hypothetical protein